MIRIWQCINLVWLIITILWFFLAKSNHQFEVQMAAIEHISGENDIEDFVLTTDEALVNIIS